MSVSLPCVNKHVAQAPLARTMQPASPVNEKVFISSVPIWLRVRQHRAPRKRGTDLRQSTLCLPSAKFWTYVTFFVVVSLLATSDLAQQC